MVTNHYAFDCPVKGEAVLLEDCAEIHQAGMTSRYDQVEDKLCAAAHICWMCPFRYAARVGGPWSKPGQMPRWDEPREKADKLNAGFLVSALTHTLPNEMDYRRIHAHSLQRDEIHDRLVGLQQQALTSGAPRVSGSAPPARKTAPKKPETLIDAVDASSGDMAAAVNDLMAAEKRPSERATASPDAESAPTTRKPKATPQRGSQSPSEPATPPMSLAERARMMRERKAQ